MRRPSPVRCVTPAYCAEQGARAVNVPRQVGVAHFDTLRDVLLSNATLRELARLRLLTLLLAIMPDWRLPVVGAEERSSRGVVQ